jgi:hypothetical protein
MVSDNAAPQSRFCLNTFTSNTSELVNIDILKGLSGALAGSESTPNVIK